MKNRIAALQTLATLAGQIILPAFRRPISIVPKQNGSSLTAFDVAVERCIRDWIAQYFPGDAVSGEELAPHKTLSEYEWVIDPIDGTTAFISGKPTFCILIALIQHGIPVAGIIYQPIRTECWIGQCDAPSLFNGCSIVTSSCTDLSEARFSCTTPDMFITDKEQRVLAAIKKQVKLQSYGGDAYAYGLLASGHIDVILEADLQFYDVAALIPVIQGAGGVITNWQGQAITKQFNGQCLAAANSALHAAALTVINNTR